MDTSKEPSPRIGQAERDEAQRALNEHLNAGRLQPDEYGERFAAAGAATVAAQLAVLFTDLPAPHPKLPGMPASSGNKSARNAIIALVAVGLAIAAAVLIVGLSGRDGGPQPTAAPAPPILPGTSDSAQPTTTSAPQATDTTSPGGPTESAGAPITATVRHQGPLRIVEGGQGLDLDAAQSDAQWAENDPSATSDIAYYGQSISFSNGTRYVLLGDREADYQACSTVNGYVQDRLGYKDITAGNYLCILTSDKRYMAARVTAITSSSADMSVVSYDPPIG